MAGEPAGWARTGWQVRTGRRPARTLTLADLARQDVQADVSARVRRLDPHVEPRAAALTVVHAALHAVGSVLLAPLVVDGLALAASPERLGIVFDARGEAVAHWLDRIEAVPAADPVEHVAALALSVLEPVVGTARRPRRIGARALANVVLDSLHGTCERLARGCPEAATRSVADHFLAAAGPAHRPGRLLEVRPDAGPPLVLRVPRTCCVLATRADGHSCPTCPQHPDDDARLAAAVAWLSELDGAGFELVAGRPRRA